MAAGPAGLAVGYRDGEDLEALVEVVGQHEARDGVDLQARFDLVVKQNNLWSRTNTPFAALDPADPTRARFTSTPTDTYRSELGLTKTNVLGGQWALNWTATNTRVTEGGLPLNPQTPVAVTLGYTQPLLQGAGFQVNMAPIVIARLNTERSYFQYKDGWWEAYRQVNEKFAQDDDDVYRPRGRSDLGPWLSVDARASC